MTTSIKVQRETYEKDGKQYHAYFIEGELRGIPFRAGVKPPDFGGYTVLDIVYAGGNCADLVVTPYEIKTEDGNVIAGNTYAVQTADDETGEIYSCKVVPSRQSDKALLGMLFR